jgi:integrase
MFPEYINHRSLRGKPLRESTKELYERQLFGLLSSFANRPIKDITSKQVNDWFLEQVAIGHVTSGSKGYKLLKAMLNHAVRSGYLEANVCDIPGAQTANSGRKTATPTPSQIEDIARRFPSKYSFAIILAAYAGLRYGEWTELRRKDIEIFESNGSTQLKVHVQRAAARVRGQIIVGEPKSAMSKRVVEVTSALIPRLETHLLNFAGDTQDHLLFPLSKENNHLPYHVFRRFWKKALQELGIPLKQYPPHCVRHFAATEMHRQGANLAELKMWLGDSSTEAVSKYMHVTDRTHSIANLMRISDGFGDSVTK